MNLAAIQAQMLQTLLAAMQSADRPLTAGASVRAVFTGWATPDGQPPASGQTVAAQALIGREPVTVMIATDAARRQALQPGAVMTLEVEQPSTSTSPARMRLTAITQPLEQDGARPRAGQAQIMTEAGAARLRNEAAQQAAPQQALATMARALAGPVIGAALARQDSLAPLLANLAALSDAAADPRQIALTTAIPRPILAAAEQVLAMQLPVNDGGIEPAALKQAILRSGLFHEAQLARGQPAEAATDLKSALLVLRDAIRTALGHDKGAAAAPRDAGSLPDTSRARPDKAVASQPVPMEQPAPRPTPPMRDGLPQPQAVSAATIDLVANGPAALLNRIGEQTEAALDRLSLSQFASLSTPQESNHAGPVHRWFIETPLGLNTGPGVLPLEIEADHGSAGGGSAEARTWRVRFALDLDPIGPIHGLVSMQAKAVTVAVWAERESTSKLVRDFAPDLQAALEETVFERAEIEVITGKPAARPAASGYYLDRVS